MTSRAGKRAEILKREKLKRYFRANPGTAFILTFQALLAFAAVALVSGDSVWANELAIYAFYALVVGVAIQVGVVIREERKRTRADSRGDAKPP